MLSNINKYITVFTSILTYSDTGRKLSCGEGMISQQGKLVKSGTKEQVLEDAPRATQVSK